jgi:hypothetical protein
LSTAGRAWEDIKREGQNAFQSVGNAYNDILVHGRLMDRASMLYSSYFLDQDVRQEYDQYLDHANKDIPDPEPEDLEPWS